VITPVVTATRTLLEKDSISGIEKLKCQSVDVVGWGWLAGDPVEELELWALSLGHFICWFLPTAGCFSEVPVPMLSSSCLS